MFGGVPVIDLKKLEGMGKTQVQCNSSEEAKEFCEAMWEQYPHLMKPVWVRGQTNWRTRTVHKFYLPKIDKVDNEVEYCQSADYPQYGYEIILFADLKVNMDFGEIQQSDFDIKSLFGMG